MPPLASPAQRGDAGAMVIANDPVTAIARILRHEAAAVARLAEDAIAQGDALRRACALLIERCGDGKAGRLVVTIAPASPRCAGLASGGIRMRPVQYCATAQES